MRRTLRKTPRKTLLIVCEGTNTEPLYFNILKDKAIDEGIWDSIVIVPEPPKSDAEKDDDDKPRTRAFKGISERPLEDIDATERKYLPKGTATFPTPLNFVKEARDRLANGVFDEAWVAFDKDGHPAHEAAFALAAENDKPVNIAFSSRSFEQWILLHFEKNQTHFEVTECKIRQKGKNVSLGCMTDKRLEGSCEGDKCLVGYLRKNHLSPYTKTGNIALIKQFKALIDTQYEQALTNTAWLRAKQRDILRGYKNKLYLLNPYTTVDVLVKQMLGISEHIEWIELGQIIKLPTIHILFELSNKQHLTITFTNKGKSIFMLNPTNLSGKLYVLDTENGEYQLDLVETFTLPSNQIGACSFTLPHSFSDESLIHFKIENHHLIVFPHQ